MFHFEPSLQDGNLHRRRAQLARLDPPALYKRAVSVAPSVQTAASMFTVTFQKLCMMV